MKYVLINRYSNHSEPYCILKQNEGLNDYTFIYNIHKDIVGNVVTLDQIKLAMDDTKDDPFMTDEEYQDWKKENIELFL